MSIAYKLKIQFLIIGFILCGKEFGIKTFDIMSINRCILYL